MMEGQMYRIAAALCLLSGVSYAYTGVEADIARYRAIDAEHKLRIQQEQQDRMNEELERIRKEMERRALELKIQSLGGNR